MHKFSERFADFCNSVARFTFIPQNRSELISLLKMCDNLRYLLVQEIEKVDRQKPL